MRLAPQKRTRRTRAEIETIKEAVYNTLNEENPMTVRQVFYQLVSQGVIEKTEAEYKRTVCRLLAKMRRAGEIPYGWIADSTRWIRKPDTYSGLGSALKITAETYRKSYWESQDVYVEVWLEKEALAGVLVEETDPWQVPLLVTRGYSSLTYLYEAAECIKEENKPAFVYYFGDYDPSGLDIPRKVEQELRGFLPDTEIHFERVAVTKEQIKEWKLPTRPTKKTDTRSRKFKGRSVEVDAIPPARLRELARNCIEQHLDEYQVNMVKEAEKLERETLIRVADSFGEDYRL